MIAGEIKAQRSYMLTIRSYTERQLHNWASIHMPFSSSVPFLPSIFILGYATVDEEQKSKERRDAQRLPSFPPLGVAEGTRRILGY